jgi:hypothetical protein
MAKKKATKVKDKNYFKADAKEVVIALEPFEQAVMQDFQLGVNHLEAAMGRYLGHLGVKKYNLVEGTHYAFYPDWTKGTVTCKVVEKKKELAK